MKYVFIKPVPDIDNAQGMYAKEMTQFRGYYCLAVAVPDSEKYDYKTPKHSIKHMVERGIKIDPATRQCWHWHEDWVVPVTREHILALRPDMILQLLLSDNLEGVELSYQESSSYSLFAWLVYNEELGKYQDYHSGLSWEKDEVNKVNIESLLYMFHMEFGTGGNILHYLFGLVNKEE